MPELIQKDKPKSMNHSRITISITLSKKREDFIWHPERNLCKSKISFLYVIPYFP